MIRDFKGVWIPREIWLSPGLSMVEKCLLIEIDSLDNENHCFATNEYFAEFLNITPTTVSTAISNLKEYGLIELVSFNGRKRVLRSCVKSGTLPLNFLKADIKKFKGSLTKIERLPLKNLKHNNTVKDNNLINQINLSDPAPPSTLAGMGGFGCNGNFVSSDQTPGAEFPEELGGINVNSNPAQNSGALPAEKPKGKAKAAKKVKAAKEPEIAKDGLYPKFIDIYYEWYKSVSDGIPPKIDGAGGKAAKSMIAYLKTAVSIKNPEAKENEETLNSLILNGWRYIFANWYKLDLYHQNKTRLIDINSNFQNILSQIKNGSGKRNTETTTASTVEQSFANLDKRFSQG